MLMLMRKILTQGVAALTFYTRIPVPDSWHRLVTREALAGTGVFLPFIGALIGGISAISFWGAYATWGADLAAILAIAVGALVTGGFHEDGLADTADGLGGGWTKEDRLRIMKDPTHGTYGILAVFFVIMIKIAALRGLTPWVGALGLIAAHTLGRAVAVSFLATHDYARPDGDPSAKSKPAASRMPRSHLALVLGTGAASLVPLGWFVATIIGGLLIVIRFVYGRILQRLLQGYTGDTLGAIEQLAEVLVILVIAAHARP